MPRSPPGGDSHKIGTRLGICFPLRWVPISAGFNSDAHGRGGAPLDLPHSTRRRSATHLNRRTLIQRAGLTSLTAGMLTATGVQSLTVLDQVAAVESATANPPRTRTFELRAQEFDWEISTGTLVRAWGYNGQVPGPELRVQENDEVRIRLQNDLSVPTTIHWHGVNVRPAMDGVAGLSQAAIEPGAEFIYEFTATPAGSRWYHSHTDPALQVPIRTLRPVDHRPHPTPSHVRPRIHLHPRRMGSRTHTGCRGGQGTAGRRRPSYCAAANWEAISL